MNSNTREILTLQFGHYSNFIGAHWWNLQEQGFEYGTSSVSEINNDVLYREGLTDTHQVTFTPRLLLVDLQGSLKTLSERGDLYEPLPDTSNTSLAWDESLVEVQETFPAIKTQFQEDLSRLEQSQRVFNKTYDFDKEVEVWSDFLYSRFHPRTVNVVKDYQHCNENTPFDAFGLGTSLWETAQFEDEFKDKIRQYIEECDSFQGFHILTDCTNGYAGLSSSCIEHLRDEYDRKSILAFPVVPSYYPDNDFTTDAEKMQSVINDSVRVVNLALSFNCLNDHSSMFVPLSTGSMGWRQPGPYINFHHIEYNHKIPYHSSAILAAALETITTKHRLKSSHFGLVDLSVDLTSNGRKAVAASLCFPFGIYAGQDLLDCLDTWDGPLSKSITPRCKIGSSGVMQHITLRGINEDRLKKPLSQASRQRELPAYQCNSITEMLNMYLTFSSDDTISHVTVTQKPLDVRTPFPKIFDKFVGPAGDILQEPQNESVEKVPVLAGLHNGREIGRMLECLHTEARKVKIARFHQFTNSGLEKDDYEECLDNLFTLRENYEDNYSM